MAILSQMVSSSSLRSNQVVKLQAPDLNLFFFCLWSILEYPMFSISYSLAHYPTGIGLQSTIILCFPHFGHLFFMNCYMNCYRL